MDQITVRDTPDHGDPSSPGIPDMSAPVSLPESGIRLISINHRPTNGDLHCKLTRFERESCPPYIALSYVWGSSDEKAEINLDGHDTVIGRNLYNALLQFQDWQSSCTFQKELGDSQEVRDSPKLWIWADAICINQGDDVEKSHQVSRMDEIYASAAHVVCWLGLPEGENTEHLQELMQAANERGKTRPAYATLVSHMSSMWCRLAAKPWFGRMWVVQEYCNAKAPVFAVGKYHGDGESFLSLKECLDLNGLEYFKYASVTALTFDLSSIREFYRADLSMWEGEWRYQRVLKYIAEYEAEQSVQSAGPKTTSNTFVTKDVSSTAPRVRRNKLKDLALSIVRFLGLTLNQEYSVRHDRIFAGLGMCRIFDWRIIAPSLYPDYQKSFEWACQQYATFILSHSQQLSILAYGSFKDTSEVPSWVPNFEYKRPMVIHRAFEDLEAAFTFKKDGSVLSVQGIYLGELVIAFDAKDENLDFSQIDSCISHKDPSMKTNGPPVGIRDVIENTISIFRSLSAPPATAHGLDSHNRHFSELIQDLIDSADSSCWYLKVPMMHHRNSTHKHVMLCSNGTILLSRHRRTDELEPGDAVVAFKGLEHPVVLRQYNGGYRFLGGCEFISPCAERKLDVEYWATKELQAFDLV